MEREGVVMGKLRKRSLTQSRLLRIHEDKVTSWEPAQLGCGVGFFGG